MRINPEIKASVDESLRTTSRTVALEEIEFLKTSAAFQDKRVMFGSEGQRSNYIWQRLHEIAHD